MHAAQVMNLNGKVIFNQLLVIINYRAVAFPFEKLLKYCMYVCMYVCISLFRVD